MFQVFKITCMGVFYFFLIFYFGGGEGEIEKILG